jgi:hypothetical protein
VPADDGFRLEDQECLFPRTEDIGHDTEEDPVTRAQSESRGRTNEYFELYLEQDDLQLKLKPWSEESETKREEGTEHLGFCPVG